MAKQKGTVVRFDNTRGFGFIQPAAGGKDVFVHFSAIQQDGYKKLEVGDEVTYGTEIGRNEKVQACDVVVTRRAGE